MRTLFFLYSYCACGIGKNSSNRSWRIQQKKEEAFLLLLAVRTGLEPATPCVTGMYSNQLNYRTILYVSGLFFKTECKGTAFF